MAEQLIQPTFLDIPAKAGAFEVEERPEYKALADKIGSIAERSGALFEKIIPDAKANVNAASASPLPDLAQLSSTDLSSTTNWMAVLEGGALARLQVALKKMQDSELRQETSALLTEAKGLETLRESWPEAALSEYNRVRSANQRQQAKALANLSPFRE